MLQNVKQGIQEKHVEFKQFHSQLKAYYEKAPNE